MLLGQVCLEKINIVEASNYYKKDPQWWRQSTEATKVSDSAGNYVFITEATKVPLSKANQLVEWQQTTSWKSCKAGDKGLQVVEMLDLLCERPRFHKVETLILGIGVGKNFIVLW